jgi:hypothetical protein
MPGTSRVYSSCPFLQLPSQAASLPRRRRPTDTSIRGHSPTRHGQAISDTDPHSYYLINTGVLDNIIKPTLRAASGTMIRRMTNGIGCDSGVYDYISQFFRLPPWGGCAWPPMVNNASLRKPTSRFLPTPPPTLDGNGIRTLRERSLLGAQPLLVKHRGQSFVPFSPGVPGTDPGNYSPGAGTAAETNADANGLSLAFDGPGISLPATNSDGQVIGYREHQHAPINPQIK